jgi:hypothetical protein
LTRGQLPRALLAPPLHHHTSPLVVRREPYSLALVNARACGIQVTGLAVACSHWHTTFNNALANVMMELRE